MHDSVKMEDVIAENNRLKEENEKLRKSITILNDRLSARTRALNRSWQDSYDDCSRDREDR